MQVIKHIHGKERQINIIIILDFYRVPLSLEIGLYLYSQNECSFWYKVCHTRTIQIELVTTGVSYLFILTHQVHHSIEKSLKIITLDMKCVIFDTFSIHNIPPKRYINFENVLLNTLNILKNVVKNIKVLVFLIIKICNI